VLTEFLLDTGDIQWEPIDCGKYDEPLREAPEYETTYDDVTRDRREPEGISIDGDPNGDD